MVQREAGLVDRLIGGFDRSNGFRRKSTPLHAFTVYAMRLGCVARGGNVWRQVLEQDGSHCGDSMRSDRDVLVHDRETAQDRVVPDADVAGKLCVVGEDRIVANLAVVREVHVGHDPVVVAQAGDGGILRGSAIERAELSDGVAVAYLHRSGLAGIFLVLGRGPNRAERKNPVVRANSGSPVDHNMRSHVGVGAQFHFPADDRIWPDADVRPELRPGMNDRGWMDHTARIVHMIFASAARASPTLALALNFQMPRTLRSRTTSRTSWSPGLTGRLKRASSIPTK